MKIELTDCQIAKLKLKLFEAPVDVQTVLNQSEMSALLERMSKMHPECVLLWLDMKGIEKKSGTAAVRAHVKHPNAKYPSLEPYQIALVLDEGQWRTYDSYGR